MSFQKETRRQHKQPRQHKEDKTKILRLWKMNSTSKCALFYFKFFHLIGT